MAAKIIKKTGGDLKNMLSFVVLCAMPYSFYYFIPAVNLSNILNTNTSGPVFILSDEHNKYFASPKITKILLIIK